MPLTGTQTPQKIQKMNTSQKAPLNYIGRTRKLSGGSIVWISLALPSLPEPSNVVLSLSLRALKTRVLHWRSQGVQVLIWAIVMVVQALGMCMVCWALGCVGPPHLYNILIRRAVQTLNPPNPPWYSPGLPQGFNTYPLGHTSLKDLVTCSPPPPPAFEDIVVFLFGCPVRVGSKRHKGIYMEHPSGPKMHTRRSRSTCFVASAVLSQNHMIYSLNS